MSYAAGLKAIKKLCQEQNPLDWQRAKLNDSLFAPMELPVFQWVSNHLKNHHALPHPQTLEEQFPILTQFETIEPSSFYIQKLENSFYYRRIESASRNSYEILKTNQEDHEKALVELQKAIQDIKQQKYRNRLLDVGAEAPGLVLKEYHQAAEAIAGFGWPYMDEQSGKPMPGDIVSFVGRPAAGKTFLTLWTALHNWRAKENVLFASMEITVLPIAQRVTSMYSSTPIGQLKSSGFSTQTYKKFAESMKTMTKEDSKFYIIDGNLAANIDEIFAIADLLNCKIVIIDGAYLVQHPNKKLDRFTRAAENIELMKRYITDIQGVGFASWQFNRKASEKKGKKGGDDEVGLEDIGYTDAIGQASSIVLGLFQEESVETLKNRKLRVLKGRNGETGQFSINWNFMQMDFSQSDPPIKVNQECNQLQYL